MCGSKILNYLWLYDNLYGKICVFFESISIYKEEEVEKNKLLTLLVIVFVIFILLLFGSGKGPRTGDVFAQTEAIQIEVTEDLVSLLTQEPSPEPSVEPTEILPIPTEEIYLGPLSLTQRETLASISLEYVAASNQEAKVVAKGIGLQGPGMMCGPLSATMLSRIGVLDSSVDPYQFYYLNPRPDKEMWKLKKMMPEDRFEYFEFDKPVGSFDFSSFPLYPGDFLYLFAGDYGSFEHMMTVTKVDEMGRAYSVTNLFEMVDGKPTGGYVISEVVLYDPLVPDTGQFAIYNSSEYAQIGRTGYRFMVIRLK